LYASDKRFVRKKESRFIASMTLGNTFIYQRPRLTAGPLGALIGAGLVWLIWQWIPPGPFSWLAEVGAYLALSIGFYAGAAWWLNTYVSEWFRGGLIGATAWVNYLLLKLVLPVDWLPELAALIVFASAFLFISRKPAFHFLLGWQNLLLPLSWAVNLPGLLMVAGNLILSPLSRMNQRFHLFRVRLQVNLRTGTLTVYGGFFRPFKSFTGLNMGNFLFIKPGSEHLLRHETGHLFSLAAMGFAFHYVGGIDEAWLQKNRTEAFAEYLAESYSRRGPGLLGVWH
jgi:hypothetical protein